MSTAMLFTLLIPNVPDKSPHTFNKIAGALAGPSIRLDIPRVKVTGAVAAYGFSSSRYVRGISNSVTDKPLFIVMPGGVVYAHRAALQDRMAAYSAREYKRLGRSEYFEVKAGEWRQLVPGVTFCADDWLRTTDADSRADEVELAFVLRALLEGRQVPSRSEMATAPAALLVEVLQERAAEDEARRAAYRAEQAAEATREGEGG